MFLKKEIFENSAILYQFCRHVDDIADKSNIGKSIKLKNIIKDLNYNSKNYKLSAIKLLIKKNIIRRSHILQLIDGVNLDLKKIVRIKNDKELISYAYLVAGTVGLMMADILKTKEKAAYKYAIDLGIAFQLTNIARDILEDAKINRIYLPSSWEKLNINSIKFPNKKNKSKLISTTKRLLSLAEKYYQSALKGLAFLNLRNRFAILLALVIYRQIGLKIIRKGFSNLYKRETISFFEKIICLLKCIGLFLFKDNIHKRNYRHNKKLHKHIKDIAIVNIKP